MNNNTEKKITSAQRAKAFAMMKEMAEHAGIKSIAHYYQYHKIRYSMMMDYADGEYFSLAKDKCTQSDFDNFLNYLLEEWLDAGVISDKSPWHYTDDIEAYLKMCIAKRICCITGQPGADIHHVDRIGMGNNRHKVNHAKYRRMSLSRYYHVLCHQMGQEEFDKLYHVKGVYTNARNGENDIIDVAIKSGASLSDISL